jgi:hypothetical protein
VGSGCALVFPPLWYFPCVPADLSWTAGALAKRGVHATVLDLNSRLHARHLGDSNAWSTLQTRIADLPAARAAAGQIARLGQQVGARHGARYRYPNQLAFPEDTEDVQVARQVCTDRARNPAWPVLREAVAELTRRDPAVVAIAAVHPDQIGQAVALGRMLRRAGYQGTMVLFGTLEDVVAPEDFAPDLGPEHALWEDFDGAVLGDAEEALAELLAGRVPTTNYRSAHVHTPRSAAPLDPDVVPAFGWVDPAEHALPSPVADLRLGRGCPWARCTFCAIQAHHPNYRFSPARSTVAAMAAGQAAGIHFFRVRDDLITPTQLVGLAQGIEGSLHQRPRWAARSRFEPSLSRASLAQAHAAGLEELWLGLESASSRVRDAMDKGVRPDTIDRILDDLAHVGIRARVLCIAGYPGETQAELEETFSFLHANRSRLTAGFSITRFQLARRSPMAARPQAHGVEVLPDPVPANRRLRWTQPFRHLELDPGWERAFGAGMQSFGPWLQDVLPIGSVHEWVRKSVSACPLI